MPLTPLRHYWLLMSPLPLPPFRRWYAFSRHMAILFSPHYTQYNRLMPQLAITHTHAITHIHMIYWLSWYDDSCSYFASWWLQRGHLGLAITIFCWLMAIAMPLFHISHYYTLLRLRHSWCRHYTYIVLKAITLKPLFHYVIVGHWYCWYDYYWLILAAPLGCHFTCYVIDCQGHWWCRCCWWYADSYGWLLIRRLKRLHCYGLHYYFVFQILRWLRQFRHYCQVATLRWLIAIAFPPLPLIHGELFRCFRQS